MGIEFRADATRGWKRLLFKDRSAEVTDAMAAEIERLQACERALESIYDAAYDVCPYCRREGIGSVNGYQVHVESGQRCQLPAWLHLTLFLHRDALTQIAATKGGAGS